MKKGKKRKKIERKKKRQTKVLSELKMKENFPKD